MTLPLQMLLRSPAVPLLSGLWCCVAWGAGLQGQRDGRDVPAMAQDQPPVAGTSDPSAPWEGAAAPRWAAQAWAAGFFQGEAPRFEEAFASMLGEPFHGPAVGPASTGASPGGSAAGGHAG